MVGANNDTIVGGGGADSVLGGGGADSILGEGGADIIDIDSGPATADGGAGNDTLLGGAGNGPLLGGEDDDLIIGRAVAAYTMDGGGGNDSLSGNAGAESLAGGTGNDTIAGNAGDDTIVGGAGADLLDGADGNDVLSYANDTVGVTVNLGNPTGHTGGEAQDDTITGFEVLIGGSGDDRLTGDDAGNTLVGGGGADSLSGGDGNDLIVVGPGGNDTADGGADTDTLAFDVSGVVSVAGTAAEFGYTLPGGDSGIGRNFEFLRDAQGNAVALADVLAAGTLAVCFAEGTRILTSEGEVPVERLRAGDLVATLAGGAPLKPVLWLGRRRIVLAGHPHPLELAPIRIRAGALGERVPHRDLLVSPDHCLFLDGVLVPARLLVNGTSIAVKRGLAEVTYFHVEVEGHAVLLAEGAPAESWLDAGNRAWFANAPLALLQVDALPDAYAVAAAEPCAPVLQGGPRLAAIRDAIVLRAAAPDTPRRASA